MKAERTHSEPRLAQLEAANARLRAENAQLWAAGTRWQALQRRLGLDSSATDAQPASSVWQAASDPSHLTQVPSGE